MSRRTLLNLSLAAIVVALGLVAYFRPGLAPETAPATISPLGPESISRIHVTRSTREPLTFTRQADGWILEGEPALPASGFQINSLLAMLQVRTRRSYPADTLELATLGLEPAQASISMNDTVIHIGITEPLENRRYVQVGATVYLIADKYQHLINADRSNFIARRLLPPGVSITRLQLPDRELATTDEGLWQLAPDDPAIGADAIRQMITHWESATALYVRRYDDAAATAGVSLEFASAAPLQFRILSRTPELVLARPDWGIQYHLGGDMDAKLFRINPVTPAPE